MTPRATSLVGRLSSQVATLAHTIPGYPEYANAVVDTSAKCP